MMVMRKRRVLKAIAASALVLSLAAGIFLANDYYYNQRLAVALRPCTEAIRLNPDSGGLPCYQAALHADPNNQDLQFRVATNLVCIGRFEEARSLYQKAASGFGFGRSEAKKMLQPGAMQQWKTFRNRDEQANAQYRVLHVKHGQEEVAFEASHPTREEPYRTQMEELVKRHVREEREMMIARGAWQPAVLKQPYFSAPQH